MDSLWNFDDPRNPRPNVAQTPGAGGLMAPGGPVAPVLSTQLPQMQAGAPPMAQDTPSLIDRIKHGLSAAKDDVGGLLDHIRPQAPDGYDGLLSAQEIQKARPSLLGSIFTGPSGSAADHYRDNLNDVLKMKGYKTQLAEQQRIMDGRRTMADRFPLNPNASQEESNRQGEAMYLDRVRAGDFAGAAALEKFAGEAAKVPRTAGVKNPMKMEHVTGVAGGPYAGKPVTAMVDGADPTKHISEDLEIAAPMNEDVKAFRTQSEADRQAQMSALQAQRNMMFAEQDKGKFLTANKGLVDSNTAYTAFQTAYHEAKAGNPAALKSAIISYAGVADPKAQLRQGVIKMIEQVDPSVRGRWDIALARLESGTLPPSVLDNMAKLVERTHHANAATYKQHYDAALRLNPELGRLLPTAEDQFTSADVSAGAPTTGVKKVRF